MRAAFGVAIGTYLAVLLMGWVLTDFIAVRATSGYRRFVVATALVAAIAAGAAYAGFLGGAA